MKLFLSSVLIPAGHEQTFADLGLTDKVVVPHWDADNEVMQGIDNKLKAAGYETVTLANSQALVIDGDNAKVIG